jgi:hypothetical protein
MSTKTKKLGSGTREVPAQKAQKWYPVDDDAEKKKVRVLDDIGSRRCHSRAELEVREASEETADRQSESRYLVLACKNQTIGEIGKDTCEALC